MTEKNYVKTAVRWRPATDNKEKVDKKIISDVCNTFYSMLQRKNVEASN